MDTKTKTKTQTLMNAIDALIAAQTKAQTTSPVAER
jgi:hypothetical protein